MTTTFFLATEDELPSLFPGWRRGLWPRGESAALDPFTAEPTVVAEDDPSPDEPFADGTAEEVPGEVVETRRDDVPWIDAVARRASVPDAIVDRAYLVGPDHARVFRLTDASVEYLAALPQDNVAELAERLVRLSVDSASDDVLVDVDRHLTLPLAQLREDDARANAPSIYSKPARLAESIERISNVLATLSRLSREAQATRRSVFWARH